MTNTHGLLLIALSSPRECKRNPTATGNWADEMEDIPIARMYNLLARARSLP